jgi:DNA-binding response OmpR family regulator
MSNFANTSDKPYVLVADDEREVASLVAVSLSRAGMRAVIATNGEEAIETIEEHTPDAAVLDIMMPNLNGYEVVRRVRSEPKTVRMPIILLSARAGGIDRDFGLRLGADAYVRKPFLPKDLVATVARFVNSGRAAVV